MEMPPSFRSLKPFAQAVVLITVFTVATRIIGFLFRIFLSRVLGAEMLGVYQIAMSFFMVVFTLVASGLPLAISKEVAKAKERRQITAANSSVTALPLKAGESGGGDIGKIAVAGLVISLIVSTALCGIVLLFNKFVGGIFTDDRCLNILLILLPSVIACSVYTALRAVWWGEKKFFLLGATELLEQIIRVVFFVVLIAVSFAGIDAAGLAALSFTIACFVSAAAVIFIFIRLKKPGFLSFRRATSPRTAVASPLTAEEVSFYKPLIKTAAPITGMRVLGSIGLPIISIIIPFQLVAAGFTKVQAIAQYGIVIGMTMPLLTIPGTVISAFSTVLVPELSGAHQRKDYAGINRQISNALKFTLFITFLILPAFIALGEPIGLFLYNNALSGTYLAETAWVMVPLAVNQTTNAILNSLGAEMKAMRNYLLGSVALFAIVWFAPAFIGANALTVGLGVCTTVASFLNLLMIRKLTAEDGFPKDIVRPLRAEHSTVSTSAVNNPFVRAAAKSQTFSLLVAFSAICIPAVLLGEFLFGIIEHVWPLIISLPIAGAASIAVVLLFVQVFNLVDFSIFIRSKSTKAAKGAAEKV